MRLIEQDILLANWTPIERRTEHNASNTATWSSSFRAGVAGACREGALPALGQDPLRRIHRNVFLRHPALCFDADQELDEAVECVLEISRGFLDLAQYLVLLPGV